MGLLSCYLRTVSPEAMRFFGNPKQRIIMFPEELEEEIQRNNGKNPCYISLAYISRTGDLVLPAILFDFDAKGVKFNIVTEESKRLAEFLREKGYSFVRMFTGNRGFHVILFIKPAANPDKNILESVQKGFIDFLSLSTADLQVCGDVRRMTRIPGCVHPKTGMLSIVVEEHKGTEPELELLYKIFGSTVRTTARISPLQPLRVDSTALERAFQKRPCFRNAILSESYENKNPPHSARFAVTAHLLSAGIDHDTIFDYYSTLEWFDFDPEITFYQIANIKDGIENGAWSAPSCNGMIQRGLCMGDRCPVFKCQPKSKEGRLLFG